MELTVILSNLSWLVSLLLSVMSSKARGIYFHSSGPGCGGLLTKGIVERTIKGTSTASSNSRVNFALLNSTNAWCPVQVNTLQHLTIKLVKPAILSGFEIQGQRWSNNYVTSFKLGYQPADQLQDPIKYYPTDTNPEIFRLAPKDGDEIMYFSLNGTKMKTILFLPLYWSERICIRVELYGCVPVDGNFTSWSEWTGCSSSCGDGTAVRYRSCSNPTPANGGQDCLGDVLQTKACTGVYCPVDGGFSDWSNWTECSVRCRSGFQTRTRTCINPSPVYGGKVCEGATAEGRRCSIVNCSGAPVNQSVTTRSESNKYFIPMVGSAALLALVMLVLVNLFLFKRFKRKNGDKNVKVVMI